HARSPGYRTRYLARLDNINLRIPEMRTNLRTLLLASTALFLPDAARAFDGTNGLFAGSSTTVNQDQTFRGGDGSFGGNGNIGGNVGVGLFTLPASDGELLITNNGTLVGGNGASAL